MACRESLTSVRCLRSWLLVVSVVAAVLAAACGSSELVATSGDPASIDNGAIDGSDVLSGLRRCEGFSVISADPSFYRDEPVYIANEQPTAEVRAWALGQPGYEDIWIDRDHRGWITVGFSSDVEARQADLEAEFPGVGVVAAAVEHTASDLEQLRDELFAVMQANDIDINGGSSVPSGQVSVFVGVLDEATLELFAEFAGRPVCFDGIDPVDSIADGPQPTSGDGWRLLAVERTGASYRTGVASTDDQYLALWTQSGLTSQAPPVDFETEIVIWFGAVYGSGCEIRMDDVVFDTDRAIVHGDFVIPGIPASCNDDANPEAYLVAVDRGRLPVGRFAIQLNESDPPSGVPEERTLVAVDLSAPGSTAADADIGFDPALVEQADGGYVVVAGGIIEPGYPAGYRLDLSCRFEVIGPINSTIWQSDNPAISAPTALAWATAAEPDGTVLMEILLETDPPTLTLSANGHSETYHPAPTDKTSDCP